MEKKNILTDEDYERMEKLFISVEGFVDTNKLYSVGINYEEELSSSFKILSHSDVSKENQDLEIVTNYYKNPLRPIELWEGYLIGLKIIIRQDGFIIIFAIAKTSYDKIIKDLQELTPKYTTRINSECYMWRDTPGEALRLLEKIKSIDGTLRRS